ncbi:MAG TPA: proline dehydrogenase family protein, partial [Nitrolancea sp.]|nr:proline dehydrogenase family protein [Nitrolancea sp.]
MLRSIMLGLAGNDKVTQMVSRNGISKGFALRFVAGETFDEALEIVRELNASGLSVTLDALGENVRGQAEAEAASAQYLTMLDGIAAAGVNSTMSLKLTMLGLDISDDICRANLRPVLERARDLDTFVRIDMEGSPYTRRTLDIFYEFHQEFGDRVGIVLQSYLYRTGRDIERAIEQKARVRLVKGAYAEPPAVAYPRKETVDAAYRREMNLLLEHGNYPAIATHDEAMIEAARDFVASHRIPNERFEFQMLYGIRRDLQDQLVKAGYNVRVYVPFGRQWYPYF